MKQGKIKVTIVGYYTVDESEIANYQLTEFDLKKMARIDESVAREKGYDISELLDWFEEEPSISFEPA